jgi:CheY-specific phosphatase CheX
MSDYDVYSRYLVRSVSHIFKNFLDDREVEEVYETQCDGNYSQVAVEFKGSMVGEIIINLPPGTLRGITKKFVQKNDSRVINRSKRDVAGELANLITGTFANQLQYADHYLRLSAPEHDEDPLTVKALYDNINLSFQSLYGGFDIDLYFRDADE